jgi:hypothetical protein
MFTSVKSNAASNNKWQSVYADEIQKDSFIYYVKYGNLSIARAGSTIYVKNSTVDTHMKIKIGYSSYGGFLTNGRDMIYQYGKKVYLWKNIKKKSKLFTLKKKDDVLVARYGNDVYYERNVDYDLYQIYKYNLKTKKTTKTLYYNGYYCNGKYLIVNGQFHEGASAPLILYNMRTGKTLTVSNHASFANAAIIKGSSVYYIEMNDKKWWFRIIKYDLKSRKKTSMKMKSVIKWQWLDKNHCCCADDGGNDDGNDVFYIYDIQKRKATLYEE